MHFKNNMFLLIITLLLMISVFVYGRFLLFTTGGVKFIIRVGLPIVAKTQDISYSNIEGTIITKASVYDLCIKNSNKLPLGAEVIIQRIDISLEKCKLKNLMLNIYNGRLKLAFSDTILFYGDYKNMQLNLALYSKRVSAREIIDLFTRRPVLSTLSGVFTDVNMHIAGTLAELAAEGNFYIENIAKERFSMLNCSGSLLMYCDNLIEAAKLNGEIVLRGGQVSGGKTALIKLGNSKIVFDGDPKRPKLNIRGSAKVSDVSINMVLQGTVDSPKLLLSSMPVMAEEILLVMLATGRTWGGTRGSLEKGRVSADLIKDFVDYFLFAGTGSKIASRFGISDISLIYRKETNAMGVTTQLADTLKVGYEVETPKEDNQSSATEKTKHTVKGEVKITDTISVNAEKQIHQITTQQLEEEKKITEEGEEKLYLKFKKKF